MVWAPSLGNSGVSETAMEQKRGLPQNNTNIHHLVSCSPVLSSLWRSGIVSSTHSLQVCSSSQHSAIEEKKHYNLTTNIHTYPASHYFLVLFTQGDPHILLRCTKNLHKFTVCNKIRNTPKFPRYSNEQNACTHLSYFCGVSPLSSKIYSLVEPSQGRITLRNSGVSELQNKREGCHKTIQMFTFLCSLDHLGANVFSNGQNVPSQQ